MMKIVIACDNDNLLDELLKNAELEVVKIPTNEKNIIDYLNVCCDMLILDFQEETNYDPIVEQIYEVHNKNIVISATEKRVYFCFTKNKQLLDLVKSIENFDEISDSKLKDLIYDMLWKLHFNMYLKGVIYLTDAIMLAYKDNSLLYDTNELMSKTAKLHDLDEKNIRNNIDNALNLAFKFDNVNFDIDFFDGYYDGRKISLKYFISLSVHYLEQIEKNNLLTEIK